MSGVALIQLGAATITFIAAASMAKAWAVAPSLAKAIFTLLLYSGGNILMMRLIRLLGMATAFSVSAVLQLVAVNLVALLFYGERVNLPQGVGIVLAIVAVALVSLGPGLNS
ncbi:hypothetical protein [Lichenifustis flavocetrariae]|uniref:Uncharacterized protein n=1 Tax=Lichenifustis flavocetrariae TaxID=2949735 RepID=A0AA41YUW3_9HYPH|nr:hypothetical protein [Lichenifustis flavocetrariae]MCW6507333.1 hypothetical protein [Lichenifustis flavocetrariae]